LPAEDEDGGAGHGATAVTEAVQTLVKSGVLDTRS
jgi:hypothetical protein